MPNYYCQIAGLPELTFEPSDGSFQLGEFLDGIVPYLEPAHLTWLNMLLMIQGHKAILDFFEKEAAEETQNLPYPRDWFDPESEHFISLPDYLQKFSGKFWLKRPDNTIRELEAELSYEYYRYLMGSGNIFLEWWAIFEMNLKNYLSAKQCEAFGIKKNNQVVEGSDLSGKLTAFPTDHKEIQVDWPLAGIIDEIMGNDNLLKRELAIDRLKWDLIDEFNLFRYFTMEVILGYTLKLIILSRWNKIYLPEEVISFEDICENIWKDEIAHNPV